MVNGSAIRLIEVNDVIKNQIGQEPSRRLNKANYLRYRIKSSLLLINSDNIDCQNVRYKSNVNFNDQILIEAQNKKGLNWSSRLLSMIYNFLIILYGLGHGTAYITM